MACEECLTLFTDTTLNRNTQSTTLRMPSSRRKRSTQPGAKVDNKGRESSKAPATETHRIATALIEFVENFHELTTGILTEYKKESSANEASMQCAMIAWAAMTEKASLAHSHAIDVENYTESTKDECIIASMVLHSIDASYQAVGTILQDSNERLAPQEIPTIWTPEVRQRRKLDKFAQFTNASDMLVTAFKRTQCEDAEFPRFFYRMWIAMGEDCVKTCCDDSLKEEMKSYIETITVLAKQCNAQTEEINDETKKITKLITQSKQMIPSNSDVDHINANVSTQALAELLASKPEGYDATRNESTAEDTRKAFNILHRAIHQDEKLPHYFLEKLTEAQTEMRKSPAMCTILDTIDAETQSMQFKDESHRMVTRLQLMHKHFTSHHDEDWKNQFDMLQKQVNSDLNPKNDASSSETTKVEDDESSAPQHEREARFYILDVSNHQCPYGELNLVFRDLRATDNWTTCELRGNASYVDNRVQTKSGPKRKESRHAAIVRILRESGCDEKQIPQLLDTKLYVDDVAMNALRGNVRTEFRKRWNEYCIRNAEDEVSASDYYDGDYPTINISSKALAAFRDVLKKDNLVAWTGILARVQKQLVQHNLAPMHYSKLLPKVTSVSGMKEAWKIVFQTKIPGSQEWVLFSAADLVVDAGACSCLSNFLDYDRHVAMRINALAKLVARIIGTGNTDLLSAYLERPREKSLILLTNICLGQLTKLHNASVAAHCLSCPPGHPEGSFSEAMLEQWITSVTRGQGAVCQCVAIVEIIMYKVFQQDAVHVLKYVFSRLSVTHQSQLQTTCRFKENKSLAFNSTILEHPITCHNFLTALRHLGYTAERFVQTMWEKAIGESASKCLTYFITTWEDSTATHIDGEGALLHCNGGPLVWMLMAMGHHKYKQSEAYLYVKQHVIYKGEVNHISYNHISFVTKELAAGSTSLIDKLKAWNEMGSDSLRRDLHNCRHAENELNSMLHHDHEKQLHAAAQKKRAQEKKACSEKERKAYENWNRNTRRPLEVTILESELVGKPPPKMLFSVVQELLRKQDSERQEADESLQRALTWARTIAIPANQFREADKRLADQNKRWSGKVSPWISAEVKAQRDILALQLRPPKPSPAVSTKPRNTDNGHKGQKCSTQPAKRDPPYSPPKLVLPDAVDTKGIEAWENKLLETEISVLMENVEYESSPPALSPKAKANVAAPSTLTPPKVDPPDELLCPISFELMTRAVMSSTGQCFQEEAITSYIKGKCVAAGNKQLFKVPCPKTGLFMDKITTPCYAIRTMAQAWKQANPHYR